MKKFVNLLLTLLLVVSMIPVSTQEAYAADTYLTFTAGDAYSSVTLKWVSADSIEYSTDGTNFKTYRNGITITLKNVDDKVYFRGNGITTDADNNFVMTGIIYASGDVTSLINGKGGDVSLSGKDSCFNAMFKGCSSLRTAPNLPSTVLSAGCYQDMFSNCANLEVAPTLPSLYCEDSCYRGMFSGCIHLTTAPKLPAMNLAPYCYYEMFKGCSSLKTAPELPATVMAESCYRGMFYSSKITSCPDLPATTLAKECYRDMFYGCYDLTSCPELPATTLAQGCYQGMFFACTGITAPCDLPATTLATNCYGGMFAYCHAIKLTTYKDATTKNTVWSLPKEVASQSNWSSTPIFSSAKNVDLDGSGSKTPVAGVSYYIQGEQLEENLLTFTAEKAKSKLSLTWDTETVVRVSINGGSFQTYGKGTEIELDSVGDKVSFKANGIEIEVPNNFVFSMDGKLAGSGDVTSLLNGIGGDVSLDGLDSCFKKMFYNCTALTSAPNLPSTELASSCYCEMFYGCEGLTTCPELPALVMEENCYQSMFSACKGLTTTAELPATKLATECYYGMYSGCTNLASCLELPATVMASGAYKEMFKGCTSLKTLPQLSATTLAEYCYSGMFSDCTGLSISYAQNTSYNLTKWTIPSDVTKADNWNYNMFSGCKNVSLDKSGSQTPKLGGIYYIRGERISQNSDTTDSSTTNNSSGNSSTNTNSNKSSSSSSNSSGSSSSKNAGYEAVVEPIVDLLNSLLKPLLLIVGSAGTLYCVLLGIKYARAEEPQDREKAKAQIRGAIIGFGLIFILIVLLNQFIGPLTEWVTQYQSTL